MTVRQLFPQLVQINKKIVQLSDPSYSGEPPDEFLCELWAFVHQHRPPDYAGRVV